MLLPLNTESLKWVACYLCVLLGLIGSIFQIRATSWSLKGAAREFPNSARLAGLPLQLRDQQPILVRRQFSAWASALTGYGVSMLFASVLAGLAINFPDYIVVFCVLVLVAVLAPYCLIWRPTQDEVVRLHENIKSNYEAVLSIENEQKSAMPKMLPAPGTAGPTISNYATDMLEERPSLADPIRILNKGAKRRYTRCVMIAAADAIDGPLKKKALKPDLVLKFRFLDTTPSVSYCDMLVNFPDSRSASVSVAIDVCKRIIGSNLGIMN